MEGVIDVVVRIRMVDECIDNERVLELVILGMREVQGGVVWKYDLLYCARIGVFFCLEVVVVLWKYVMVLIFNICGAKSWFVYFFDEYV